MYDPIISNVDQTVRRTKPHKHPSQDQFNRRSEVRYRKSQTYCEEQHWNLEQIPKVIGGGDILQNSCGCMTCLHRLRIDLAGAKLRNPRLIQPSRHYCNQDNLSDQGPEDDVLNVFLQ